jgi:hypothetical protein
MTSEAHLLGWFLVGGGDVLLLGSSVFAMLRGRPAERLGGALYLGSALLDVAASVVTGKEFPYVPILLLDAFVAVGFLVLAIRYNNLWLGAVMMLKGVQLALHAIHLTNEADMRIGPFNANALALDLVSVSISSILIVATLSSLRQRRLAKAAAASVSDGTLGAGAGSLNTQAPPQAA